MKKLLFILNPKAGRTVIKTDLFEIIMIFSEAGYEVVTYPTTGPDDAARKVREDGANYDLIVCAGGDGTLDNTVNGYISLGNKNIPLGYIPAGTTNDFARSLNISRKPTYAARQIVSGGAKAVDVGQFGDRNFIYIAAFGIFTDISYSTKQSLKKALGHSAYVIEGIRNIGTYKGFELRAQFDDMLLTGKYIYGMITNTLSVGGFKIRGAKHVILDDGKFDCLFIKMPQNANELQQILSALLANDIEGNEMFFECKASRVVVSSEEEIPWTLDGEFGGSTKQAVITNMRQALDIILPERPLDDSEYDEVNVEGAATEELDLSEINLEKLIKDEISLQE